MLKYLDHDVSVEFDLVQGLHYHDEGEYGIIRTMVRFEPSTHTVESLLQS